MVSCEYLGKSGTHYKYKVDNRYIVYLHDYANCQNIVIDTKKNNADITHTNKGLDCILVTYGVKHNEQ